MTPRQYYNARPLDEVQATVKKAGTTLGNFKTMCYGGSCGPRLAERLAKASNGLMSELEVLYPERYQENER